MILWLDIVIVCILLNTRLVVRNPGISLIDISQTEFQGNATQTVIEALGSTEITALKGVF